MWHVSFFSKANTCFAWWFNPPTVEKTSQNKRREHGCGNLSQSYVAQMARWSLTISLSLSLSLPIYRLCIYVYAIICMYICIVSCSFCFHWTSDYIKQITCFVVLVLEKQLLRHHILGHDDEAKKHLTWMFGKRNWSGNWWFGMETNHVPKATETIQVLVIIGGVREYWNTNVAIEWNYMYLFLKT